MMLVVLWEAGRTPTPPRERPSADPGREVRAPVPGLGLTFRELTPSTWKDFVSLFGEYNGVQAGCWCMFYHRRGPNRAPTEELRQRANRQDHRKLVEKGEGQGILVYQGGRPIGWCQYGRRESLPRIEEGRKYAGLPPELRASPRWRITCFFVHRPYRRRGVAGRALRAALRSIASQGGGLVEAYPATNPRAVGVWFGSVGMFRREGFEVVCPFGQSNVLVRRSVAAD